MSITCDFVILDETFGRAIEREPGKTKLGDGGGGGGGRRPPLDEAEVPEPDKLEEEAELPGGSCTWEVGEGFNEV